jgi:hypothetical protein
MDDKPPQETTRSGHHSLFWPFLLIGIGILWLLSNLGILSLSRLWGLARFWPVLLIAIGVDLLLGRRHPWIGALIGILTMGLVAWLLFVVPASDVPASAGLELKSSHLSEPIGAATSAKIRLDLANMPTTVKALSDSTDLIDATLMHRGEIAFRVTGDREKIVTLGQARTSGLPFFGFSLGEEGSWDIGLSPNLPLDMEIDGGSGRAQLDLGELRISELRLDVTSGSVRATLPAMEQRYRVQVEGGSGSLGLVLPGQSQIDMDLNVHSGSVDVAVGEGTSLDAQIDGGSGRLLIDIPDNAALRFTVSDDGSGSVTLPRDLQQVSDGNDDDSDTGTWETPGLGSASQAIAIVVDLGSGSVTVR